MSTLFQTIGKYDPEYLLADPNGCQKIAIPCEPGNGVIARGTVMYRKESGMFAPATSSEATDTAYLVVLDEDVDTSANAGVAEDAAAYERGILFADKVTLKDSEAVTDKIEVILRKQGITLRQMVNTSTFKNGKVTITYKANGGTGADKVEFADEGTQYTIANNTFTAPETKEFDKWATQADGGGKTYNAQGTYQADADLTLYAVWKQSGDV